MDFLKVLGAKDSTGNVPVNVTIALDRTVQDSIKSVSKGFIIGVSILSIALIITSYSKRK